MSHEPELQQIDWSHLKIWQVWDPIPWWIISREKLEKILAVQLDARLQVMQIEMEKMQKIRTIVAGRSTRK
jgi:hypothetical protein